jgi:hypothetical protein
MSNEEVYPGWEKRMKNKTNHTKHCLDPSRTCHLHQKQRSYSEIGKCSFNCDGSRQLDYSGMIMKPVEAEGRTAHNNVWNGANGMASNHVFTYHSTDSAPAITTSPSTPVTCHQPVDEIVFYSTLYHIM